MVLGISMLLIVACGGSDADTAAPTNPPSMPTEIPAIIPTGVPAIDPAQATPSNDVSQEGQVFDSDEVAALALSSPEFMACLTEAVGFATLLQFAERDPTVEEIRLLTPCLDEAIDNSAAPVIAP